MLKYNERGSVKKEMKEEMVKHRDIHTQKGNGELEVWNEGHRTKCTHDSRKNHNISLFYFIVWIRVCLAYCPFSA